MFQHHSGHSVIFVSETQQPYKQNAEHEFFFSIKLASFIFISFRINAADRKSRRYRFCMKPWHWHGNRFSEVILLNVEWPEYENNTVSIYIECTRNRCNVCCCRIVSGSNSFAIGICYFALDRFLHRFMLHRGG